MREHFSKFNNISTIFALNMIASFSLSTYFFYPHFLKALWDSLFFLFQYYFIFSCFSSIWACTALVSSVILFRCPPFLVVHWQYTICTNEIVRQIQDCLINDINCSKTLFYPNINLVLFQCDKTFFHIVQFFRILPFCRFLTGLSCLKQSDCVFFLLLRL